MKFPVVVATFFGAGLAPKAPGTVGTLASLVIWAPMVMLGAPLWLRASAVLLTFALGVFVSEIAAKHFGNADPKQVVIDEVAGMGLAVLLCPPSWYFLAAAFGAFRVLDIAKPWPISVLDRRIKGGLGIMLDDMLAGLIALFFLMVFS